MKSDTSEKQLLSCPASKLAELRHKIVHRMHESLLTRDKEVDRSIIVRQRAS